MESIVRLTKDETTGVINSPHKHEGKILTIWTKTTTYKGKKGTWTSREFLAAELTLPSETIEDDEEWIVDVIGEKRILT